MFAEPLRSGADTAPADTAPAAARRATRGRRRHRRRGLHRAVDRLLPRRGRPVAADRGARGRGRGVRRQRPQRRLVLGAVPRLAVLPVRAGLPGVRAGTARRDAGHGRRGGPGRSPRRASTPTSPRAAPSRSPAPPPSWPGPGRRSRTPATWGRGEDDLRLLDAEAARGLLRGDRHRRGDVHAGLRGDPPGAAGARAGRRRRPAAGSRSTSTRRSARSSPAGCRPTAAWSAPRPRSGPPRATPRPCAGHRRTVAPVYSLDHRHRAAAGRRVGRRSGCAGARRSPTTGT